MPLFDTPFHIVAFVLAIINVLLSILMYALKKRKHILMAKLTNDVVASTQLGFMFSWTGMVLNIVAIFREIIFYCREKYKFAQSIIWLFVFIILMGVVSPIISWQGWISILPSVGSVLCVIGLYCLKPYIMKIFLLSGSILWAVYNFLSQNYIPAIYSIIEVVWATTVLIILLIKYLKNKKETEKVVKEDENSEVQNN